MVLYIFLYPNGISIIVLFDDECQGTREGEVAFYTIIIFHYYKPTIIPNESSEGS